MSPLSPGGGAKDGLVFGPPVKRCEGDTCELAVAAYFLCLLSLPTFFAYFLCLLSLPTFFARQRQGQQVLPRTGAKLTDRQEIEERPTPQEQPPKRRAGKKRLLRKSQTHSPNPLPMHSILDK
jgi:hypothetical protein